MSEKNTGADEIMQNWYLRKAYWLVHSYLDQQVVCEQCRVELATLPKITWQDAFDSLSSHGDPFAERVRSSNISDSTYRIAVNIDDEIVRLREKQRRGPMNALRKAQENVAVMDTVLVRLCVLEHEAEYRNTYTFADQFCRQGLRITEIKNRNGKRMGKYAASQEKNKVVALIAEELKRREGIYCEKNKDE